jgi:hypothetical protein
MRTALRVEGCGRRRGCAARVRRTAKIASCRSGGTVPMIAPRTEPSMAMPGKDVAKRTEGGPASIPGHTAVGLRRRDRPRVGRACRQGGASPTIGAPERALWAAILSDAVAICLGRTSASVSEGGAALNWIQEGSTVFGGFSWCCEILGLDDSAIRERVRGRMWRLGPEHQRRIATSCEPTATVLGRAVSKQKRRIDGAARTTDTGTVAARPMPRACSSTLHGTERRRARTPNPLARNRRSS